MAIAKIVLNGVTQMDLTQDTVTADKILPSYTAHKKDGEQITGNSTAIIPSGTLNITTNNTYDVTDYASAVVNVPTGGGSAVTVIEEPDSHGGTIRHITAVDISSDTVTAAHLETGYTAHDAQGNAITGTLSPAVAPNLQAKEHITPTESSQTITADAGYDGLSSVQIDAVSSTFVGSGVTRKAAATYTPSTQTQTISASQYLTGAQTINPIPSQYIVPSGNKEITANGTGIDVAAFSTVSVNVPASGKVGQIASGLGRVNTTAYTAVTGQSITVGKTGTYDVYWIGYRSSTSGTNGSALYIGDTAHSSGVQTTFDGTYTNWQIVHLTNVSLTKDQVVTVRARARGTSYYMYIANLTIIEA